MLLRRHEMKVEQIFEKEQEKKHSVRYKPEARIQKPLTSIIYINRWTLAELGRPRKVKVTLEAVND
jgi:hypothetical protein